MAKHGGKSNYGWGKQLKYAGINALRHRFVSGHFGTVATHKQRWKRFVEWYEKLGLRDAKNIQIKHLEEYGLGLRELVNTGNLSTSYAQNLLSTANVVVASLRGDSRVKVSPAALVGKRSSVRTKPSIWDNRNSVQELQDALIGLGEPEVAAMVGCARDLGLRKREACLLNAKAAYKQAIKDRKIVVQRGVKGGNNPRVVPIATSRQLETLRLAAEAQGKRDTIMRTGLDARDYPDLERWLNHVKYIFYKVGGRRFHDMRVAYACDRNAQLTHCPAPVLRTSGDAGPSRAVDLAARAIISRELGHHRINVTNSYLGGRK